MDRKYFSAVTLTVSPIRVSFYMPPIVWKGDPVGHTGQNDVFLLVLKGSIVLFVDDDFYIVRSGQLVFLPKGKMRRYAGITKELTLYTMSFYAEADGINLMHGLGLTEHNHVISPENIEEVTKLFEDSAYVERNKDPIYNVIWTGNILSLIKTFALASQKQYYTGENRFDHVIEHMKVSLDRNLTLAELAEAAYMQPTYFCRCFKKVYGVSPVAYFTTLRVFRAMELLLEGNLSNEDISEKLGIKDISYFSRWFKQNCGLSPGEYKALFEKQNILSED